MHAPREGCDSEELPLFANDMRFQFTHPGRGATVKEVCDLFDFKVSIHAPREGCDTLL